MKDKYTRNLFETESDLRIIRIDNSAVSERTDNLDLLYSQIIKHEELYPEIGKWLETKVIPGIKSEQRIAYVGLNNNEPVVSAILKLGVSSKICHLHIDDELRNQHLGDLFFSMMALDAKRRAERIHFTLPESLWVEKRGFFKSFGFKDAEKSFRQYRSTKDELWSSASFKVVWGNVLRKLPKIIQSLTKVHNSIFSGILMSIKPKYVARIQSGEKTVEIRKQFSMKWQGCRVTIYSSTPEQALYGYATIEKIRKGTPEEIWSLYGEYIGGTRKEFKSYTASKKEVYAIFLKDFQPYLSPVFLSHISFLLENKTPSAPESYLSLEKNEIWARAVSIAELLHNRFWIYTTY